MRNILVVSVNWLGDVVFSTPVYRALKEKYPSAKITVFAVARVKGVLELCPHIDEVIVYDESRFVRGWWNMLAAGFLLRRRRFDAVFILRRSLSRSFITWLAGIPVRAGFVRKAWAWLLTHPVDDAGCGDVHRRDVYLKVLESFGVNARDRSCYLEVSRDVCERVSAKLRAKGLSGDKRIVVLNTGGNWALKQWPADYFALLTERLVREAGFSVVLSGALSDVERVRFIAEKSGVQPVMLAGDTDLKEMAALFKRACVVVSADSGPLHVASAVGANVVALFGPTRPEITGPCGQGRIKILQQDLECNRSACYRLTCPDSRCMKAITVEDVFQTFRILKS